MPMFPKPITDLQRDVDLLSKAIAKIAPTLGIHQDTDSIVIPKPIATIYIVEYCWWSDIRIISAHLLKEEAEKECEKLNAASEEHLEYDVIPLELNT